MFEHIPKNIKRIVFINIEDFFLGFLGENLILYCHIFTIHYLLCEHLKRSWFCKFNLPLSSGELLVKQGLRDTLWLFWGPIFDSFVKTAGPQLIYSKLIFFCEKEKQQWSAYGRHKKNIQGGQLAYNWRLTAGVSVVTPRRQSTSPLLLIAHRGTVSTLLWAAHGRMVTSLRGMGGISCHGPVVVNLHFLCTRAKKELAGLSVI